MVVEVVKNVNQKQHILFFYLMHFRASDRIVSTMLAFEVDIRDKTINKKRVGFSNLLIDGRCI